MATHLSVYHLPIVLSIHGERPSMTRLAFLISDIRLPNPMTPQMGQSTLVRSHGSTLNLSITWKVGQTKSVSRL